MYIDIMLYTIYSIYMCIHIYIDNYAPTGQKKLCFASRHPGKGGASKGFREAAAAAAALAANDEYIATVDGCEIHQLIGGKHPIILLGVQPSKNGAGFRNHPQYVIFFLH